MVKALLCAIAANIIAIFIYDYIKGKSWKL